MHEADMGLTTGYGTWSTGMQDLGTDLTVPRESIGLIILLTLMAAIICTILPACKASRTDPAEAVGWVE